MSRFEPKFSPALYAALFLSMAVVFIADVLTPLGIAVWVFYAVPIVLTFYLWRPAAPLVVGVLVTLLTILGSWLRPPGGVRPEISLINQSFEFVTVWAMACIGFVFVRNKCAVRFQEWLQSGQTRLSAIMGGDQALDQLGANVLRFLAEYLDAHAGAFFTRDSTGSYRRAATYGVPAKGGTTPESFELGDGLLGQAAKDKRLFFIPDVPAGYLAFGSALGQGIPRQLLIAPICVDSQVTAVLELGFLHLLDPDDSQLLERVSESIAVAVRSAQYRRRLQDLLTQTQQQAEELQAQGQELRVSNEELEEQSRALKDSQQRLELQQTELEQTNAHLEEQNELLATERDAVSRVKKRLQEQARELERANRYKSEFLANMSHELRTPLNSILILAKLLADNPPGNLSEEQIKYAQTIQSSGNDLLALINDILDLSKIEAGRMEVRVEPVKLAELMGHLGQTFEPAAAQKGIRFSTQIAPDCPETIHTDQQRLEQILKNLLSNALKFTEQGEVKLDIRRAADKRLALAVTDTGIGIAADQLQMVFEAFRQAGGTIHRKHGGTGLGLSISRELARLLGGDIQVVSELGRGSTFTVTIPEVLETARGPSQAAAEPARPPVRSVAPPPPPSAASAPTIPCPIEDDRDRLTGTHHVLLIVEDDEPFARILSQLAHELNFDCLIATTAEQALALTVSYRPSAVVLDIGLPDHSGLTVLDRLKHDVRTRHIPVHVVSASDHAETARALGAAGYLLKPVKREQLAEALRHMESLLAQRMRRVLIVEDDAVQRDSLQKLLGSHEVETVGAASAAECLEHLRKATFDCMVLDLALPDTSGYDLLETLSREDAYAFPPVIVYTGRDLSVDEEQRLRRYSKSIIIKGAKSPERLLDEVTLFLHQVVSELPPEQQRMLERARSRDAALEGRRILVVEDDVRNVFALTSILEPRGARVQIARNGREALAVLEQAYSAPEQQIDLVLMDVMMPEMDGFTATRAIRQRPEWQKLPIIMLTAKAMKGDLERCLEAGANDYLAKPLDVEKLLSLVRVWMPR
jgi:signal transduction histidine kinase/CheY-like chemotaxis protein